MSFVWEDKKNNQFSFCISTDGIDPYQKGITSSFTINGGGESKNKINNTTEEDACEGDKIIDYFCNSDASSLLNTSGVICPNGCEDGACLR